MCTGPAGQNKVPLLPRQLMRLKTRCYSSGVSERLSDTQEVGGSIPPSTTKVRKTIMNAQAKAQDNRKKQWQYVAANYDS